MPACTIKTQLHYEIRIHSKNDTSTRCFLFLETALESFRYQLNILSSNMENHAELSIRLNRVDPAHPESCCFTLYSFDFSIQKAHPAILPSMSAAYD